MITSSSSCSQQSSSPLVSVTPVTFKSSTVASFIFPSHAVCVWWETLLCIDVVSSLQNRSVIPPLATDRRESALLVWLTPIPVLWSYLQAWYERQLYLLVKKKKKSAFMPVYRDMNCTQIFISGSPRNTCIACTLVIHSLSLNSAAQQAMRILSLKDKFMPRCCHIKACSPYEGLHVIFFCLVLSIYSPSSARLQMYWNRTDWDSFCLLNPGNTDAVIWTGRWS